MTKVLVPIGSSSADGNLRINGFHPRPLSTEDGNGVGEFTDLGLAFLDGLGYGGTSTKTALPSSNSRETIFDGDTLREKARSIEDVVGEKSEIGESDRVSDHPFTVLEVLLEDTKDTENFVTIPLNSGGDLFGMQIDEPVSLAVVRALAASLEEKPLHDLSFIFGRIAQEAVGVVRIVSRSEVKDDSVALPDGEVVVVMIDESRNTTVGIKIDVWGLLLLVLVEVEEMRLVLETELFHDEAKLEDVGHVHADMVEEGHSLRRFVGHG